MMGFVLELRSMARTRSRHFSARALGGVLACCLISGCSNTASRDQAAFPEPHSAAVPAATVIEEQTGPLRFVDVAEIVGIHFHHRSPLTEQRHLHLFMGSGIGWLDFDRNGFPDLYCCQGAALQGEEPKDRRGDTLFMNRSGTAFTDVTRRSNLPNVGYSMGVAAADYNNDGFADLCVSGYGENYLLLNYGDGCFTRVPLPSGQRPGRLSASCTWADFDDDGNLDLFITNYAQLGPDDYPTCEHTAAGVTIPISCHPANFKAVHDLLYRSTGRGDFEDVSVKAGIVADEPRAGLGVVAADLDSDGDTDFYVANDTTPNHLWENQGDGQFLDRASDAGTARNRFGATEAGMGLVVGDIIGNGRMDLFVTNYYGESNTLYRNEGNLLFTDITDEIGLGAPSRARLGFGTSLADFDNDGWLDLLVANGHVQDRLWEIGRDEPFAQLPLLFHHDRGSRFQNVSDGAGDYFRTPRVARSTAVADFDGDHDLDVAINCLNGPSVLLQNEFDVREHWLQVELIGVESNRSGIGAELRLEVGNRTIVRCLQAGSGYLSCDDATLLIGLGPFAEVRRLTVAWPNGRQEVWNSLSADRRWRFVEGCGEPVVPL